MFLSGQALPVTIDSRDRNSHQVWVSCVKRSRSSPPNILETPQHFMYGQVIMFIEIFISPEENKGIIFILVSAPTIRRKASLGVECPEALSNVTTQSV